MSTSRDIILTTDALAALGQILAIMTDQALAGEGRPRWDVETLMSLEVRLGVATGVNDWAMPETGPDRTVTLDIGDAALLLDGMAFTEMASVEFPWFDMVRWTADFITTELRQHWTDDEWRNHAARP